MQEADGIDPLPPQAKDSKLAPTHRPGTATTAPSWSAASGAARRPAPRRGASCSPQTRGGQEPRSASTSRTPFLYLLERVGSFEPRQCPVGASGSRGDSFMFANCEGMGPHLPSFSSSPVFHAFRRTN